MNTHPPAPEAPLWIEVNERRRTCWSCTPADVETLAVGFLRSSGYIETLDDLRAIEVVEEPDGCVGVRATVAEAGAVQVALEQRRLREHGCGVLHYVSCEPGRLPYESRAVLPDAVTLRRAFRDLFAATDAQYPDGGMHGAGLLLDGELQFTCFDVGRHNAVDRAIGGALRRGLELPRAGLLLSARVSGAMAFKAARAGIGYVASRSIPTSLAHTFALAVGLPLIARAGRDASRETP